MLARRKLALALLTVLAAGCGGGGGGSSSPPPPATPTVTTRAPAAGATEATETAVVVQFSEAMDPASLATGMTVGPTGGAALAGSVTVSGATATFTPAQLLPAAASLTVTLSADVRSAAGGRLGAATSWSFTTAHWRPMSSTGVPTQRSGHTAVWTGTEMIVWGGSPSTRSGGRYAAATDSWTPTSITGAPIGRIGHTAVWTGREMIVWGGSTWNGTGWTPVADGARYNPATDTWTALPATGAPSARSGHVAVWTGTEMIVWGGAADLSGARYNPSTDTWTATTLTGAPPDYVEPRVLWTGSRMVVWGGVVPPPPGGAGVCGSGDPSSVNTGAVYDPATDTWTATPTAGAPVPRKGHVLAWTGSALLVSEGYLYGSDAGGSLAGGTWTPFALAGAPSMRAYPHGAWTGSRLLAWSGLASGVCGVSTTPLAGGESYDPATDTWAVMPAAGSTAAVQHGSASVWTGTELIVWGGDTAASGARFTP